MLKILVCLLAELLLLVSANQPRVCTDTYCLNGGTCTVTLDANLQCRCPQETTGSRCEFYNGPIDNFRVVNPTQGLCSCENRDICRDSTCACLPNSECSALINYCRDKPCKNGGSCVNGIKSHNCICPPGFTDTNCSTVINNCIPQPCKNGGICVNNINSYDCKCPPGFTDHNCSTVINSCVPNPCKNEGRCVAWIYSYQCICRSGFTGRDCSVKMSNCIPQPCQNGGTCINGIDSYTCLCPPTYGGPICSSRTCTDNYCFNGGTCAVSLGINIQCRCPEDTAGSQCQFYNGPITNFKIKPPRFT
ncbi:hypothetical protein EMCRGX_G001226 [Ephydatia muelleri]